MLRAKCLMILGVLLFTEFCNAKYYNSVLIDGYKIHFEKEIKGVLMLITLQKVMFFRVKL